MAADRMFVAVDLEAAPLSTPGLRFAQRSSYTVGCRNEREYLVLVMDLRQISGGQY